MMPVLVEKDNKKTIITKGAPESVFKISKFLMKEGRNRLITKEVLKEIKKRVSDYEKNGYRVIIVAEKNMSGRKIKLEDEKDMTITGFLLFLDPPKKEVEELLEKMQRMKVNIKILSGDSPIITEKVCKEVGFNIQGRVIIGEELEKLSSKEFEQYSIKYNVFARVTPEQKYKIVNCLKNKGHVTGFLGDGINDAPALKTADIGISVDSATGIAKEAADIIILQKSLRVIVHGIIEGRKTFGNITKYILNTVSSNYGNMFTVSISSLFLKFIPLLPSQILLNIFLSDVPNLTIAADNVDEELLKKPRRWDLKLISRFMIVFGIISSIFDIILILCLIFLFKSTPELFRTALFTESVLSEIIILFSLRTSVPFFKSNPGKSLIISSFIATIITVAITYTVFGSIFFQFIKMPVSILSLIVIVLVWNIITTEIVKKSFFKKFEI